MRTGSESKTFKYSDDAVAFRLKFIEDNGIRKNGEGKNGERQNAVSLTVFERTGFESKAGKSAKKSARAPKVSSGRMTGVS